MKPLTATYLSLGAGGQSTALYLMSSLGLRGCPRADWAIFADTQDEPRWVYEHLTALKDWARTNGGVPIHETTIGCLSEHVRERHAGTRHRFACIPAFTRGDDGRATILRRQCTREYKIRPLQAKVRELLGVPRRARVRGTVGCLLGISLDEIERCSDSRTSWVRNLYPLIDAEMRRSDCETLIGDLGLKVPGKSACVFCPFHSDGYWLDLKQNHPEEWARAVEFDAQIRGMTKQGIRNPVYLHRSLVPLIDVDLGENGQMVFDWFANECAGVCGV